MSASQPSKAGRQWIDLAALIDDVARELIRYCLRQALDENIDSAEAWLDTAREILGEDGPEQPIISFLRSGEDKAVRDLTARVAWLQARARKLDAFVALSGALSAELSQQRLLAENELARTQADASQDPKASGKSKKT